MNNEVIKSNEDLVVGTTDYDPAGYIIYDSMLGKLTTWYGIAGAVILGTLGYLIASGVIPVRDFGQFAASGNGVATFVAAVTGLATGGLTGALVGLHHIVKKNNMAGQNKNEPEK